MKNFHTVILNNKDLKDRVCDNASFQPEKPKPEAVMEVFNAYQHNLRPQAMPDGGTLSHIKRALSWGYSVECLLRLIKYAKTSKFLNGQNRTGVTLTGLNYLFSSGERIDQLIQFAAHGEASGKNEMGKNTGLNSSDSASQKTEILAPFLATLPKFNPETQDWAEFKASRSKAMRELLQGTIGNSLNASFNANCQK